MGAGAFLRRSDRDVWLRVGVCRSRGTAVTFMPPNGLLRLLRFLTSFRSSMVLLRAGPRCTVEERIIRDGRRFCSVAADLEGCHCIVLAMARASQKGHSDEEMRNMV